LSEQNNIPLTRFESMLKTNNVYFFDSSEFEDIIHYYLNNGKIALAKKATKLGLEQHPTSTNLKLFQVEMFIFENELEIAEELLENIYLLEQFNEEVFIQKANILSRRDKHLEAIKMLEKAHDLSTEPSDVLSLIGMEYLFLEDFENAKKYFIQCLFEDSEDFSALYNIIYCFEYLNQTEEAIEYLNGFLNKNPYCEVAWHQVGKQYFLLKEYRKALAAFDFAIISDDRFIGNSELALQFFNKCVEEDALLDKGWIAITDYYIKAKNFKKALYYINKAINIDSENVLYWKRYGKINFRLNLYEEAEVGYRKTLELGNYELNSWLTRNDILLKLGEFEAAKNNLFQAKEFYEESAEIEYRLAGLFFKNLEFNKGEFHLKNALKLDSEFLIIIEELFPKVYSLKKVKEIIKVHKKASL